MAPPDGIYPNKLKELRLAAFLTRATLADKTMELEKENEAAYSAISARSLEHLEQGKSRPRIRVANALAKALGASPSDVFPQGPDDGVRNPSGATRIPLDRKPRGRAKK